MNQRCGTSRKRKGRFANLYEALPENAEVSSIVYDEAVEKMGKQLRLWIHGVKTNKSTVDGIVMRLKAKEIDSHVTQGQEDVKPFSVSAGWLDVPDGETA